MPRRYMGMDIYPCERADDHVTRGRWTVQTYHGPSKMPWADELCPHFHTLEAARQFIREWKKAYRTE